MRDPSRAWRVVKGDWGAVVRSHRPGSPSVAGVAGLVSVMRSSILGSDLCVPRRSGLSRRSGSLARQRVVQNGLVRWSRRTGAFGGERIWRVNTPGAARNRRIITRGSSGYPGHLNARVFSGRIGF